MFNFLKKDPNNPKPCKKHDWKTVASEFGYSTTYEKGALPNRFHIIDYRICQTCNLRSAYCADPVSHHKGIHALRNHWEVAGKIKGPEKLEIYDPEYMPRRGLDAELDALRNSPVFKKLRTDHQSVENALGNLEVIVKLAYDQNEDDPT